MNAVERREAELLRMNVPELVRLCKSKLGMADGDVLPSGTPLVQTIMEVEQREQRAAERPAGDSTSA